MKKHYIDKGKSTFGIPRELINTFDEMVFEYSKKIYNFLINKFEAEDIPLTGKGLIDIEKIYKIIAKGAKGEYTEHLPEKSSFSRLASVGDALWKSHYNPVLTLTNKSPRILLSPKIKAELDEIVFAYSQGIYRALISSYRRFEHKNLYDKEVLTKEIQEIIISKSTMPPVSYYKVIDTYSGYYTSDVEDDEGDEAITERPLLIRYIESNMVIGAKNLIKQTGVDVNTKDDYGRSALFYANSLNAITMLLGQGADVNIIDKLGNNVLHIWGRKSLLTPMSHTCRDQIFGSFVDKLTIPQDEGKGPFSLINHNGQDVRYMFLLGSQYFHLSAEKRLPDIYDYNSLCGFVRNKIIHYIEAGIITIPTQIATIIQSYLIQVDDLSLENVLSYYEKSKSSFDLSKIQNYGLPLLHRLALNTITNTPNDKNLELFKKLCELDPKQLEYASTMGNPLDIVLNRSETIEAPKLQKEFISFFIEKGGKVSEKTKIGKLNKHLSIFQEHLGKIADIIYNSWLVPKEIIKIIIDYLPIFETGEENSYSISFSSSCSSGSSCSSSLPSSLSQSTRSSYSESDSNLLGENIVVEALGWICDCTIL